MWKNRNQLDLHYGSLPPISNTNDLRYESWGEEQPYMGALISFSDLDEDHEISGRYLSVLVFAIACFTLTGVILALFLAFNMTPSLAE